MSDDYECEDCLGIGPAHGCYCAANGAVRPGGPRADAPGEPLHGDVWHTHTPWWLLWQRQWCEDTLLGAVLCGGVRWAYKASDRGERYRWVGGWFSYLPFGPLL